MDYNEESSLLTAPSFSGGFARRRLRPLEAFLSNSAITTSLVGWQVTPSQSSLVSTSNTLAMEYGQHARADTGP